MFGSRKKPPPPNERLLHCSFCNKSQRDVKKLIAGPDVQICDECVDICLGIIAPDLKNLGPSEGDNPPVGPLTICALCHVVTSVDQGIAVRHRGMLCPGCVGEVQAAIAEAGGKPPQAAPSS